MWSPLVLLAGNLGIPTYTLVHGVFDVEVDEGFLELARDAGIELVDLNGRSRLGERPVASLLQY